MPSDISEIQVGKWTVGVLVDGPMGFANGGSGPRIDVTYFLEGEAARDDRPFTDYLIGIGSFATSSFNWPAPHRFPGTNLPCIQAGLHEFHGPVRPMGDKLFGSDYVSIRAEYGTVSWNGLDYDVFGTENKELFDVAVPWSSVDVNGYEEEHQITGQFAGGESFNRGKRYLTVMEYQVGRSYIPRPGAFLSLARTLNNRVNLTTFLGAAPGKVLCSSPSMRNHWDANGGLVRTFMLTLKERPIEWNKVLKPGTSDTWVIPQDNLMMDAITYQDGELNDLLRYGVV